MILIFSERIDLVTRTVISYLYTSGQEFEIFWEDDLVDFVYKIESSEFAYTIKKNGEFICDGSRVKSVWYRRNDIKVESLFPDGGKEYDIEYQMGHVRTRYEQIKRCLEAKKCLGVFGQGDFNKITFLENCVALGLKIPETLVTDNRKDVEEFYTRSQSGMVTKSLAFPYEYMNVKDNFILSRKVGYTTKLKENDISALPSRFSMSLFQSLIRKKFELRVFYIDGKSFAQAIFSQEIKEAQVDFRQGYHLGMRCCHFEMPDALKSDIDRLMKKLGHNTGCLDIVVTQDNDFVFLELNPNGQFGAVSEITNHNYEYEIAKFLMN